MSLAPPKSTVVGGVESALFGALTPGPLRGEVPDGRLVVQPVVSFLSVTMPFLVLVIVQVAMMPGPSVTEVTAAGAPPFTTQLDVAT